MKKYYFLAISVLMLVNISFSQKKMKDLPQCRYDFFQLSVSGGFIQPISYMYELYNPSGNVGLDFAYRINQEVAVNLEGRLNFMGLQDSIGPGTNYLEITVGPRYYFISKYVRSTFFFEAATGPYFKMQGSYIKDSLSIPSNTVVKLGANVGLGGELALTDNIYFTLKGKYHSIFGEKGTESYFSGDGGITFRF
jgi:hypothetical protein